MGRHARLAIALVAACLATGCGRPPMSDPIPKGASVQRISVDGQDRTFRMFHPENLREPAPLVVMMHGWGFTAEHAQTHYGWDDVAANEEFVVAYPLGVGDSWNAGGGCCGPAEQGGVDDVAFITEMIERLQDMLPIDDRRIYAAGMSNGGVMAYALACRMPMFAAIGAVAATQLGECDSPHRTSVIHVHGLADPIVTYDGKAGLFAGTPAVPTVVGNWRRIDDCAKPETTRRPPVTMTRTRCADDREVTLVAIEGEGHTWPGHDGSRAPWDATTELWRMFRSHSLSEAPSSEN